MMLTRPNDSSRLHLQCDLPQPASSRPALWQPRHGVGAIPLTAAPDFLGAAAVPVPRGLSLILRAADGGFTRSHGHLFSLLKTPPLARVGSEPRPPEERSHAGTRFAQTDARALRPYSRQSQLKR